MNKLLFTASVLAAVLSTSTAFSRPLDDEILRRSARAPHATNPAPPNGDKAIAPYSLTGPTPTPDAKAEPAKAEPQTPAAKPSTRHHTRDGSKF